jgi:hypothetical protein
MGVFTSQSINVYKNVLNHNEKRALVNSFQLVGENILCRISGTYDRKIKIFIIKPQYLLIVGGIHANYKITVNDLNYVESYQVTEEPIWAGGKKHHVELMMEVFQ